MSMTLLQLVTAATGEMGLPTPGFVAGNTAADTIQQMALLNAVGNELQREYDWQALIQEYRFTTVFYTYTGNTTNGSATVTGMSSIVGLNSNFMAVGTNINTNVNIVSVVGNSVVLSQPCTGTATGVSITFSQTRYVMPSDYDRLIDGTQWDVSQHWQMIGPETMQQKEWLKSGYISTGPRVRYYRQNNFFQIWPPLGAAHYLGFDYVGQWWVTAAGDTQPSKSSFTIDTDTCVFPDRLMILGLKLKYFEIKGFDTVAFGRDYSMQLNIGKSNDSGSPTLSMSPQLSNVLINWNNIPDSGMGNP